MAAHLQKTKIFSWLKDVKGGIAMLIDPEKTKDVQSLKKTLSVAQVCGIDLFLVGGSTVTRQELESTVQVIKAHSTIPVLLFPGSSQQLSQEADALLFLSLISGRNPDYLIGHHVAAASELFNGTLEVIPTGYLLIDGGHLTSVAYVSQTSPIPRDQHTIVRSTAMAGILLGQKVIYLDAGSGAETPVPVDMIREVSSLGTPLIVGGGIRSMEMLSKAHHAGANLVVIGNYLEEHPDFLLDIATYKKSNFTSVL
ncbi:MAG: geranylgeranylglyceryl/heptaprenylglyceryl phosphate synthase [Cryomorphaceae bacterium]|jgi:putative glycerol-1-phosphate prenyltransferase|nr:geranylgeranylglyceryl/heptaprenylglyceryl phosphate synthase [Cryomorphaceae bacterium]